ncbi:MAG: hypothetical protein ABI690_20565 [Chloroflexota bacterium]
MNRRILLVLGVVFAVLIGITYLQSRPTAPVIPTQDRFTSFIGRDLNMTVLDIQAIRLRDPQSDKSFVISRDANGNWTAPDSEGSLDTTAASNIAKTVVAMPYSQSVSLEVNPDLTQYGFLPNGSLLVDIVLNHTSEGHAIAVGGLSPNGLEYYVLVDDKPQVLLIQRGAVDYLKSLVAKPPLT